MRGLVISKRDEDQEAAVFRRWLDEAGHVAEAQTWRFGQPDHRIVETLARGYDFILVPLDLPHFSSVRLAELAHRLGYPSKVILVGDAADDLKFTERLYDRLLGSAPTRDKLLAAVTEEKPRRGKMLDDLTSAIGVLVLHAPCFSVKFSPNHRLAYVQYKAIRRPLLWSWREDEDAYGGTDDTIGNTGFLAQPG